MEGELTLLNVPIALNFVFPDEVLPLVFDLLGYIFGIASFPVEEREVSASTCVLGHRPIIDKRIDPSNSAAALQFHRPLQLFEHRNAGAEIGSSDSGHQARRACSKDYNC